MGEIGLALGSAGSGVRRTLGLSMSLTKTGIHIQMVCGSSGSIIAAMLGAGMSAAEDGRSCPEHKDERYQLTLSALRCFILWRLLSSLSALGEPGFPRGILRGARLESFLREKFGDMKMSDLKMPCAVVSGGCAHRREDRVHIGIRKEVRDSRGQFFSMVTLADAVRASCSIPGVFVWKEWDGRYLVDGAVRERCRQKFLKELGCDYVIAVDLGYTGQADASVGDLPSIIAQSLDILGEEVSDYVLSYYADSVIKPRLYNVALTDVQRYRNA